MRESGVADGKAIYTIMISTNVIAVFDIGKTNKKLFLFDEEYRVVYEKSEQLPETTDEDGDACEDIDALQAFVLNSLMEVVRLKAYTVKAVNFSTYGASFVYVNEEGKPLTPLYNYLKKYPESLKEKFYKKYGGEEDFSLVTASPLLGSLNSGLQLYRFKKEQPELFAQMKYPLHLPQYISSLVSHQFCCERTSIGCHTGMWNFKDQAYHSWITEEDLVEKLPPLLPADTTFKTIWNNQPIISGIGLHDSSSSLIPYLAHFNDPFILISTGTWCISLNPFNDLPLTSGELKKDCLCYLTYKGQPVKASRLFAGNEHEQQVTRLAEHFNKPLNYYKEVPFNQVADTLSSPGSSATVAFGDLDLLNFPDYSTAYLTLMSSIVKQQIVSTKLVLQGVEIKRLFVDGGFSNNSYYMNLLALALPGIEVYAASMAQASALGAALAIHNAWNTKPIPKDIIELKYYSGRKETLNF